MRVSPRFCFCAVVALSVTFDTGLVTRLSNHVSRTVTLRAGATLMPASPADQALRPELIVGTRRDGADRELAVQLGERRRAEPGIPAPHTLTRSVT